MTDTSASRLVVLGTVNLDQAASVATFPAPGETVVALSFAAGAGGKGANQATAAARTGGDVVLVSAVGDDDAGRSLCTVISNAGVDTSHVFFDPSSRTGTALITVTADGENSIVVAPGAAANLDPAATAATVASLVRSSDVFLTQLELPQTVVDASCRAARIHGGRVVLNYSPVRDVSADVLAISDPVVVNAGEAAALAGFDVAGREDAERAALEISARTRSVVITLGGSGAVCLSDNLLEFFPAPEVNVVDTTGAGDCFAGTLSAALAAGKTLGEATRLGVGAGSAGVQYLGAQPPA